jgi:Cytochrome bd terminal oxidase subunit I
MDALILARMQFAANITFHILFPTISIGMGWLLLFFRVRWLSSRFHKYGHAMRSMDFVVRLGAHPPPHSTCGKGGQRRMAAKDTISCGRICESDY